jgi:hypothetical protein
MLHSVIQHLCNCPARFQEARIHCPGYQFFDGMCNFLFVKFRAGEARDVLPFSGLRIRLLI